MLYATIGVGGDTLHPLAYMGIAVVVAGLAATVVALTQLARHQIALGPVLLGNLIPLALFAATTALSTRLMLKGRKGTPILFGGFVLATALWWYLNG